MALYLPDANVLIHSLRKESADHRACRQWLLAAAEKGDEIGLTELVEAALLRVPTLPKLQLIPMSDTIGFWREDLWSYPRTCRLSAGPRHAELLSHFINRLDLCGNDINDAWIATLAIEHRAILVSTDLRFGRFPGLDWLDPRG